MRNAIEWIDELLRTPSRVLDGMHPLRRAVVVAFLFGVIAGVLLGVLHGVMSFAVYLIGGVGQALLRSQRAPASLRMLESGHPFLQAVLVSTVVGVVAAILLGAAAGVILFAIWLVVGGGKAVVQSWETRAHRSIR